MESTFSYDNFDTQMIRNQIRMLEEQSIHSKRMESIETQLETIINGQHSIIGTINRAMKKNKRHAVRKTQEVKFIKQKKKAMSSSDVSKLMHLPEALQRNISKFTQNILFTSSNIQDELVSMQCLSEDECTDITSQTNPKDQVRRLIRKIQSRGPESIDKFLEIVKKDQPELIKEVYKTLDDIVNEYKDKPVCAICVMQNTVDLKDIVDSLYEEKIISGSIFDIIVSSSLHHSRSLIWSSIMAALNDLTDHGKAKTILINALQPKYDHIVGYINQNPDGPSLNCWSCTKCRQLRHRPLVSEFGSQTDLSLPSSRLPNLKALDDDNVSVEGLPSSQSLPSTDLLSYTNPEFFENIQIPSIDSTPSKSSTWAGNINNNEHFVPETAVDNEFSNSREREPQQEQELQRSISTISNASTLCPEISNSAPNTAGIDLNNTFKSLFQLVELKKVNNKSNPNDKSNLVNLPFSSNLSIEVDQSNNNDQDMDVDISREIVGNQDGIVREKYDNKCQGIGENETTVNADKRNGQIEANIREKTNKKMGDFDQREKADNEEEFIDDRVTRKKADNKDQGIDSNITNKFLCLTDHDGMGDYKTKEIADDKITGSVIATAIADIIDHDMGDGKTRKLAGYEDQDTNDDMRDVKDMGDGICKEMADNHGISDGENEDSVDDKVKGIEAVIAEENAHKEYQKINGGISTEIADSTQSINDGIVKDIATCNNTDRSSDDGLGKCNTDVKREEYTNFNSISQPKFEEIEMINIPKTIQTRKHLQIEESSTTNKVGNIHNYTDTTSSPIGGSVKNIEEFKVSSSTDELSYTGHQIASMNLSDELKIKGVKEDKHLEDECQVSSTSHDNGNPIEKDIVSQEDTTERATLSQEDTIEQANVSRVDTTDQATVLQEDTKEHATVPQVDTTEQATVSQEDTKEHATVSQEDTMEQACSGGYSNSSEQVRKDKNKRKREKRKQRRK